MLPFVSRTVRGMGWTITERTLGLRFPETQTLFRDYWKWSNFEKNFMQTCSSFEMTPTQ